MVIRSHAAIGAFSGGVKGLLPGNDWVEKVIKA